MALTESQLNRYSRQLLLPEIGQAGQDKIMAGKVLLVGAGGLGSPAALYLASAGIGTLGIVDSDTVDLSNLQRQILHSTSDLDVQKVLSASLKINHLNPDVTVIPYPIRITALTIRSLIDDYDFIIDATDNFETKFLINDACVDAKKPFSHAGVSGFEGQTMTYLPGHVCYRCVFPNPPIEPIPTCSQGSVMGVVPGIVGTIQAAEALKYIVGMGDMLIDKFLVLNVLTMKFRQIPLHKNLSCRCCL